MSEIFGEVRRISPSIYSWNLGTECLPHVCSSEKFSIQTHICGHKYEFYFQLSKVSQCTWSLYLWSLQTVRLKFDVQITLRYQSGQAVNLPNNFCESYGFRYLKTINTDGLLEIRCSFLNVQYSTKPGCETDELEEDCGIDLDAIREFFRKEKLEDAKCEPIINDEIEARAKGLCREEQANEKKEQRKFKATLSTDRHLKLTCHVSTFEDPISPSSDSSEPKSSDSLKETVRIWKQLKECKGKCVLRSPTGETKVKQDVEEFTTSLNNRKECVEGSEQEKEKGELQDEEVFYNEENSVPDEMEECAVSLKEMSESTGESYLDIEENKLHDEYEMEGCAVGLEGGEESIEGKYEIEGKPNVKDETKERSGGSKKRSRSSKERAGSLKERAGSLKERAESLKERAGSLKKRAGTSKERAGSSKERAGSSMDEGENSQRNELQNGESKADDDDQAEEYARELKREKENIKKKELQKWKGLAKLSADLENAFLKEEDSDVVIKVGDEYYFAHKVIIKNRSSVFRAMLEHDMREKNEGSIEIPDCDPHVFRDFLLYLYTGKLENIPKKNVFKLYYMSDKYDVYQLRLDCVDFLANNLSIDIICDVVTLSTLHCESDLLKLATEFFVRNAKEVFQTVEWQVFLEKNPVQANELIIKAFQNCYKNVETSRPKIET